jgi:hypothetical protein
MVASNVDCGSAVRGVFLTPAMRLLCQIGRPESNRNVPYDWKTAQRHGQPGSKTLNT